MVSEHHCLTAQSSILQNPNSRILHPFTTMAGDNNNHEQSTGPQESLASAFNQNNTTQSQKNIEESLKTIITPQSQLITLQLDESNYILWKFQVENAIKGYGLEQFISNSSNAPPKFIMNDQNITIMNPEFLIYQRQDHLLSAWLLSAINPSLYHKLWGAIHLKKSGLQFNKTSNLNHQQRFYTSKGNFKKPRKQILV